MRAVICLILLLTSTVYPQWVKQNPINPQRGLCSIDFVNNTGWSVGDSGTIVKTTNGGLNWTYQSLPSRLVLMSTEFVNENTGFVCGDSGKILRTTNGGTNWEYQNTGRTSKLYKLFFVNQSTGFCVGFGCILKTTNAGNNWFYSYHNEAGWATCVYFINEQTGWVSANNTIFRTTDCGANWDTSSVSGLFNQPLLIFFINQNTGWASYGYPSQKIDKTANGGNSWFSINTPGNFNSLYFIDENTGFGIGNSLFKSTNGGINWVITEYSAAGSSIIFQNLTTGYTTVGTGMILKTSNSGVNWTNISPEVQTSLFNCNFLNSSTGFALGFSGVIVKTTNGGLNWTKKTSGTLNDLSSVSIAVNNTCYIVGRLGTLMKSTDLGESWQFQNIETSISLFDIKFTNEYTGWICGDSGTILKTINGGNNWSLVPSGVNKLLFRILPLNQNKVFIVGLNGMFLRSTNAGLNWVNLSTDSTTWYTDIFFLNDLTGWVSTFGVNRILKTTDGGNSWQNIPTDIAMVKRLIFFDENTGYAFNGLHCKTTNGGTNWILKDIALTQGNFDNMYFIDINTGWAVGEFGLIYKTTNGGLIPVSNISSEVPKSFALYQNYPNPFNPTTTIKFSIPPLRGARGVTTRLIIYDELGREISVLVSELLKPGTYEVEWNASDFPSGVYFYKLDTDEYSVSKKMVLIK